MVRWNDRVFTQAHIAADKCELYLASPPAREISPVFNGVPRGGYGFTCDGVT